MTTLLKKLMLGETPLQKNTSPSPSSDRSPSTRSPAGRNSSEDSKAGTIPPEPVQLATEGDFSLSEAERPLQVHNLARASKLCKALEWDSQLARDAAAYAKTLASTGVLERSGIETAGENLYYSKDDAMFEEAVDAWLNQEKLYDGKAIVTSGTGLQEWGYFTQCVWKNTLHVGMGRYRDEKTGETYIVARYTPAGNINGEMPF